MHLFPKKERILIKTAMVLHPLLNALLAAACFFCSLAKVGWMFLLVAVYWLSVSIYWCIRVGK